MLPFKIIFIFLSFFIISSVGQYTYVQYDSVIPSSIQDRLTNLINQSSPLPVILINQTEIINRTSINSGSIIIAFGNTAESKVLISQIELDDIGPESFIIRSSNENNIFTIVTNGNSQINLDPFKVYNNIGLHYGCYELLKQFGFGFLHPLEVLIPSSFRIPSTIIDIVSTPRWPIRGWHYHTEHPLELTEFLNGMDSGSTNWDEMIDNFYMFSEWLIANKQNRLEWVLLWTSDWDEFAWSSERQNRLLYIVDILHDYGIGAGADVPIAEQQQHAWYMTGPRYTQEQQLQNITDHINWLMVANFDFISTESGYSEFTHPNCTLMLSWMNFATNYLLSEFEGKRIYIKCHCSSGQVCEDYPNPFTGEALNFNFLPAYATQNLGVYPHTVQIYNLTEPAPTYGNQNFTYMLEFLLDQTGKREVVFHGETAYWVNYDIDVPLFLPPVYGANRISDMRIIAKETNMISTEAQGQVNFGSGWEWSYWLGDLLTCSAVWDPLESLSDEDALSNIITNSLQSFGSQSVVEEITSILIKIIQVETDLLVYGNWNGTIPNDVVRRNGQAYLAGWDTWSEWAAIVNPTDATQPAKLTFHNIRDPFQLFRNESFPDYQSEIQPLLDTIVSNFTSLTNEFINMRSSVYPEAYPFFDEIIDSLQITTLRAQEVYALYDYVWGARHKTPSWRQQRIQTANQVIVEAQHIIEQRESKYRVPIERIAGWRENPTAYPFCYLWTVHSAYYFWRDYSQATNNSISTKSPCFMNIITPIDIAFGPGKLLNISLEIGNWLDDHNLPSLGNCTEAPATEPQYPYTPIIDETSQIIITEGDTNNEQEREIEIGFVSLLKSLLYDNNE